LGLESDGWSKLFSIKEDAATKFDRGLLGINGQFLRDGAMQIRTLGVIELTQREKRLYLKTKLESLLENYGVSPLSVYSITTDNGANMVKAVTLLENDQKDILEKMDFDFEKIPDSNKKIYVDVANELEGDTQPTVLSCMMRGTHLAACGVRCWKSMPTSTQRCPSFRQTYEKCQIS
jgi:hypothetical protein